MSGKVSPSSAPVDYGIDKHLNRIAVGQQVDDVESMLHDPDLRTHIQRPSHAADTAAQSQARLVA